MSTTVTNKHRQAFTLALRNVSPSFAALHASRLRLRPESEDHRAGVQTPPLTTLTCLRCGYTSVHVRIVRLKQTQQKRRQNQNQASSHVIPQDTLARVIQRTCTTCAFVERIPVPRGAAVVFGKTPRRTKAVVDGSRAASSSDTNAVVIQGAPTPSTGSGSPSPWQSPQPQIQHPKKTSRPKKKSGLHDLLARNRQRQQHHDRDREMDGDAAGSGLASFLSGL